MEKETNKLNRMDKVLKELGELYEFNREIRRFKFVQKDDEALVVEVDKADRENSSHDQD